MEELEASNLITDIESQNIHPTTDTAKELSAPNTQVSNSQFKEN